MAITDSDDVDGIQFSRQLLNNVTLHVLDYDTLSSSSSVQRLREVSDSK